MNNTNTNNFKIKILFAELSESNGQQKIELFRNIIKLSESNQSNELNRQQKIELFRNIIEALIENEDVMRILDSSHFFVKEHLPQAFKQSSRFKSDKIHSSGVPLKESHEKRLKDKGKTSIKFSSDNRPNEELQLSNFVEQKPKLRYFTMGSKQHPKQFERWSPEEMYNWWLRLRTSGIPKSKWQILDAVFFLFINQISCICNSYIRYGIKNNKNVFKEELKLLSEYFRLLDEFYKSGGEYGRLIDTHIAFCFWFQHRFGYDDQFIYVENKNQTNNITKIFNKENNNKFQYTYTGTTREGVDKILVNFKKIISDLNSENNFSLILFTSYFQNPLDFISLYGIPVITAVGIPNKNHNQSLRFYSPFSQIYHDILIHNDMLLKYLIHLYNQQNQNDMYDINIFRKKKIFLQLLHNKRESDAKILFWFIIHELGFGIEFLVNKLIPKLQIEKRNWLILSNNERFKEIEKNILKRHDYLKKVKSNILSKHTNNVNTNNVNTNNVNKKLQYLKINDENIFNFFDIEILLEQLKLMNTFLTELTPEEKRKSLPRLLNSIDVLIETCKETLEIVKKERN
jgi:hypothetical protein